MVFITLITMAVMIIMHITIIIMVMIIMHITKIVMLNRR